MANPTEISKDKMLAKKHDEHDPVQAGKKAIEAEKKINNQDKSTEEKNNEEAKDAEQWRNEG